MDFRNKTGVFCVVLALSFLGCKKEETLPANTMKDIDGNTYKTITIGNQTWMAENLRVTRYRDGSQIPQFADNRDWSADYTGMGCDYAFIPEEKYGKLYNWHALEEYDGHYLAPEGWHIPTMEEWQTLITAMGEPGCAGNRLKDTLSWEDYGSECLPECGFNAVPAGMRDMYGNFSEKSITAWYWTSSTSRYSVYNKEAVIIFNTQGNTQFLGMYKTYGLSVRCIKD